MWRKKKDFWEINKSSVGSELVAKLNVENKMGVHTNLYCKIGKKKLIEAFTEAEYGPCFN